MRRSTPKAPERTDWLRVDALDLDGQGVCRRDDGKVVFIEGALPGEEVQALIHRKKNQWEQGEVADIRHESPQRVRPGCPHFGLHRGACGGCKVQHLEAAAQVAMKQRVLEDNLAHLANKLKPEQLMRPVQGPTWGYRYRARLSVRHVAAKNTVLIGFHERASRYVADMSVCQVLPPHVSALLLPLRELIGRMPSRDRLPQIELAVGQDLRQPGRWATALVLRHLVPLTPEDVHALEAFAQEHAEAGVQWWLQPKGPDTVHRLGGHGQAELDLAYTLPEFGVRMPFKPTDFTQVNPHINEVMVAKALRLLQAQPHERVIDWFCGLGNFTLPLATQAQEVLGIEGSAALVQRATHNAELNGLQSRARFAERNLFDMTPELLAQDGVAQRWLIDPPREGAFALSKALADAVQEPARMQALCPGWVPPRRLVYVSCNPATLARDAGLLVHVAGYRCTQAGILNMFPHTAHVESMAVFEKD